MLYTGFSRQDMTPRKPVPLGGYDNPEARIGERVLHEITLTCVAFRDEAGTLALLFSQDICEMDQIHTENFKTMLQNRLGVAPDKVFFHATHTHEAPEVRIPPDHPLAKEWMETKYYPAVLRAAEAAIADLSESELYAGKDEIFGLNYVRRYLNKDGAFITRAAAKNNPDAVHESEPDREVQVVRFARPGKQDIILVNFQAHASGFFDGWAKTEISSDYPYYLRGAVEMVANAHCAFLQGAAGNLVFMGLMPGDRLYTNRDKVLACEAYGKSLAKKALEILAFKMQKLNAGNIQTAEKTVTLPIDHSTDARAAEAKEVCDLFLAGREEEGKALARDRGLNGCGGGGFYRCEAIVQRSQMPKTKDIPVWTMRLGELGFAFAPYEMFDTNGVYVKEHSPCKMTLICELTNDCHGYLPSELAFSHGGYEVDSCLYESGAGELPAESILEALRESGQR